MESVLEKMQNCSLRKQGASSFFSWLSHFTCNNPKVFLLLSSTRKSSQGLFLKLCMTASMWLTKASVTNAVELHLVIFFLYLSQAKIDYEKEERRKLQKHLRGEDTWMLPDVNERVEQLEEVLHLEITELCSQFYNVHMHRKV